MNANHTSENLLDAQAAFLAARGLTWEEARALPEAERAALSAAYAASL